MAADLSAEHEHTANLEQSDFPHSVALGGEGPEMGKINNPVGVTMSEEGEIFVADREKQRIQVFTLQGTFLRQFPTVVPGGEKMGPHDVAVDGEGNLWVVGWTFSGEFAVEYDKQGQVLRKFGLMDTGYWRGVAVDTRRNHVVVTQTLGGVRGEVQVFRTNGTLLKTSGQRQTMTLPDYVTVDGEGNILVSDHDNHSVYVYNEDGQFLFQFGDEGSGEGQLKYPYGVCTDRAGNIIVADHGNNRVEIFDKTGKFLKHVTKDVTFPHAVAMATQEQLVVTDCVNRAVTIFYNNSQ